MADMGALMIWKYGHLMGSLNYYKNPNLNKCIIKLKMELSLEHAWRIIMFVYILLFVRDNWQLHILQFCELNFTNSYILFIGGGRIFVFIWNNICDVYKHKYRL